MQKKKSPKNLFFREGSQHLLQLIEMPNGRDSLNAWQELPLLRRFLIGLKMLA
jgi:hypothetical protein